MRILLGLAVGVSVAAGPALANSGFSIVDAIHQAVQTHPGIGEAAANRRATETELRQQQGTLLPQVQIDASIGPQRLDHHIPAPGTLSGKWVTGREASVAVRQLLYDGFSSIYET